MGDRRNRRADRADEELVRAAGAGSERAATALYERYHAMVRVVVADNVHDPDEADDTVQEVFGKAFARLGSLSDPDRFRPWLTQIARRTAIDARRRRCRRPAALAIDHFAIVDRRSRPDLEAEVRVLAGAARDGVGGLSTRDKTILTMVVELGMDLDAVAAGLGVSPDTAKVAVHRARRRLRDRLESELVSG